MYKYQIKYCQNSKLATGKVGCPENLAALLVGCLGSSVPKVNLSGEVKNKGSLRFWIASDSHSIYLCFRSLYITAILWNYIRDIPGPLCLALLIFKIDTLPTPCKTYIFQFHYHSTFHWTTCQLGRNTWEVTFFIISLSPRRTCITRLTLKTHIRCCLIKVIILDIYCLVIFYSLLWSYTSSVEGDGQYFTSSYL